MKEPMNNFAVKFTSFLFSLIFIAAATFAAPGQESQESAAAAPARGNAPLLRLLNLTPDQLAQIRRIRQENQGELRLSLQRLRQAQRALDEAIYSETADESVIEERARQLSEAQAAHTRLRALTELRVRRVLNAQQLNVFRNLQMQRREHNRAQRRNLNSSPLRRRLTPPTRPAPSAPPDR
ncbi:MAG: Spy/CpxP family protein refolding chaperone [Pyrinomonadaceae bacterium]